MGQRFDRRIYGVIGATTLLLLLQRSPSSFALTSDNSKTSLTTGLLSRRDLWKWPVGIGGTLLYGKLVDITFSRISRGIVYPPEHEQRIESVIDTCLKSAASQQTLSGRNGLFRVLEVGIGIDARLIRRNLYEKGINNVGKGNLVKQIEVTGIDLHKIKPDVVREAKEVLNGIGTKAGVEVSFQSLVGDAVSEIPFSDGYFDVIVCCLTLCSVTDQTVALQEMKRVLRSNGGVFGYVEHVAVDLTTEPYRFLDWQQKTLDPLQQLFAENCHLHRPSESSIYEVFGVNSPNPESKSLQHERFLVDTMWPVTCQVAGAVQRIA